MKISNNFYSENFSKKTQEKAQKPISSNSFEIERVYSP